MKSIALSFRACWHGMMPYISRLLSLLAVLSLIGSLPWWSNQDPAARLYQARYGEPGHSPEQLASIRAELALDQGPVHYLLNWANNLLQGQWGESWISGQPILPGVVDAVVVSLHLMAMALIVAFIIAIALSTPSMLLGLKGRARPSSEGLSIACVALPEFLLATLLLLIFAVGLGWLPPYGWSAPSHWILPALALGLPAGGLLGRLLSDGLSHTFHEPWIATWQASGFSQRRIMMAVLNRAIPALIPQISLVMVGLTGGAVAVEQVFAIPGIGRATLGAAVAYDLPQLQGGILCLLMIALILGLASRLIHYLMLGRHLRSGTLPTATSIQYAAKRPSRTIWLLGILLIGGCWLVGIAGNPISSEYTRLAPPSADLWLGADASGRDLLARLAHGAIITLGLALIAGLIAFIIGLILGLLRRGIDGPVEMANATPPVLVGMTVTALNGPSQWGALLAVSLVSWAPLAAHTRALLEETRAQPFVRMAPTLGVSPWRNLWRYQLPGIMPAIFRHALVRLPGTALALASLSFLGLGSRPPTPEWGRLLAEGMPYMERAPWAVIAPTLALILFAIVIFKLSTYSLLLKRQATA